MMTSKPVSLRSTEHHNGTQTLHASLNDRGDLVIEGQDTGDGVEKRLGVRECEWKRTIRSTHIPALLDAMGEEGEVLDVLEKHFLDERAPAMDSFLTSHGIPHERWSRMGN